MAGEDLRDKEQLKELGRRVVAFPFAATIAASVWSSRQQHLDIHIQLSHVKSSRNHFFGGEDVTHLDLAAYEYPKTYG